MSERGTGSQAGRGDPAAGPHRGGLLLTFGAGALVVLLAVAAVLAPSRRGPSLQALFLVFDSSLDEGRTEAVYEPLRDYLAEVVAGPLELVVATDVAGFREALAGGPEFVLCPDGLGLGLEPRQLVPLVVGRRPVPRNLRPRGVLVYRKSAGLVPDPWRSRPEATVLGDSLSLAATGVWRRPNGPEPVSGLACGPDPYDHSGVLQALRLGCFDYALVRQWDADRFLKSGLLPPLEWGMEILTPPVPDLVLFVAAGLPAGTRIALGEKLSAVGRMPAEPVQPEVGLSRALGHLRLVGFNLLVEPDFDLVRGIFPGDWPPASP